MVTVIIDSREQKPFVFSPAVRTVRRALPAGDYSLAGFENEVVIERKSLGDLLTSVTHERERFERELRQLRGHRLAALMIEADWPALLEGRFEGRRVHPSAAVASLMAFAMRYRVLPILCGDHAAGAALTERILLLFARMVERDYKALHAGLEEEMKEGWSDAV